MTNKYCLLFLLFQGHLVDWMHEVMHKDPVDYEYRLADLRWNPATFAKAATSSFLPWGLGNKYFRAPTLERLERVRYVEGAIFKFWCFEATLFADKELVII